MRRRELLEQARTKLEGFVKAQPNHPLAREVLVQIARMLVERGHLALLLADDAQDEAQKTARKAEARASFVQAREAFGRAVDQLSQAYKTFSGFIAKGDARLEERGKIYSALLDAMLQQAVSVYELAQTYPAGSKERTDLLAEALKQFHDLYKNYRTQMAGLTAQMWEAKCYEEQGKIGEAIGIYKSLLDQPDPRLRPLQRFVGYFHIVALSKRKDHALAADEAVRWLEKYARREERRSPEGLGVLLELAKNIDAQMAESTDKTERQQASKKIVDAVSQVVRYTSPYKNEALALLKKYKPTAAAKSEELARLTYDDAVGQADEAIASRDWERAIVLLKAADRKVDPRREIDKANRARYNLAFCYYMNKQYYESNVLAEHHRPPLSPGRALSQGHRDRHAGPGRRLQHLHRGRSLGGPGAADRPGQVHRRNLARPRAGRRRPHEPGSDLPGPRPVRPGHRRVRRRARPVAQAYRGADPAGRGPLGQEPDARPPRREGQGRRGGQARHRPARQVAHGPPGRRSRAHRCGADRQRRRPCRRAHRDGQGRRGPRPARSRSPRPRPPRPGHPMARLLEATLLAQINAGQVEPAIASMKALEQTGATTSRAQLYFKLGKLLERELDRLREKKDTKALDKMQQAYRSFLTALTESKSGQSYESLQWAGESLLSLDAGAEAEKVLQRVLDEAISNPAFLSQSGGKEKVLRTKLKLASALRAQGKVDKAKFDKASSLVEETLAQYPRYIEPIVEKGMLLESQAEAGQGEWSAALRHWEELAQKLSRMRPRPLSYFDAWYHAAYALSTAEADRPRLARPSTA